MAYTYELLHDSFTDDVFDTMKRAEWKAFANYDTRGKFKNLLSKFLRDQNKLDVLRVLKLERDAFS